MEVKTKFQLPNILVAKPTGKMSWTEDEYVNYTYALGSSQIREFIDSPNAFRQIVIDQEPRKESDVFTYGKAVHCYLLEQKKFEETYVVMPEFWGLTQKGERSTSRACKEVKDQILAFEENARVNKKLIVTEEELNDIKKIARNVERHSTASELIKHGEPEVTILFKDPITGINLKVRIDFLSFNGAMVTEVKTTMNSRKEYFGGQIFQRGYDIQVAMQMMAVERCFGKLPTLSNILAIEKEKKEIAGYYFNESQIERAWDKLRSALDGIKKCIDTGEWPMRQKQMEEVYEPKKYINEIVQKEEQDAYEHFEGAPI